MTGLSIFCLLLWRTTSYAIDLLVVKIQHEQARQALKALQRYAIMLVKNNEMRLQQQESRQILFDHWPLQTSPCSAGAVWSRQEPNSIQINCFVKNNTLIKRSRHHCVQHTVDDQQYWVTEVLSSDA